MTQYKGPVPNEAQIRYHEDEYACFLHFGMNTFTEVEWGNGRESLDQFTLENFDFEGYVKFIKENGFKRLIFTAKHHDGFCMFDTKYTEHNIINTSYGKDFLAELSSACTKYDLDMGCYLSPWDAHEKTYGLGELYNEFYQNQLIEICENPKYGNNGKFVEWWFDGAKDESFVDQDYNFDKWIEIVRKYNPEILIFGAGSKGGIHWIGNEMGYSPEENAPRMRSSEDIFIDYDIFFLSREGHSEDYVWSVPEADTCTTNGWFSHPNEIAKSKEELFNIYLKSIGRGSVLLLNIAANKNGVIDEKIKKLIVDFRKKIDKTFENKLNEYLQISRKDFENKTVYEIKNPNEVKISYIQIMEDIKFGSRFVKGYIQINGERINIPSIGYKRIVKVNNEFTNKIIENIKIILEGAQELKIKSLSIY